MTILRKLSLLALPVGAALLVSGCANTYPRPSVDKVKVPLKQSANNLPESQLLDVRIPVFDPGKLPTDKDASRGLSEDIRKAETKYTATELKGTLQQTGYWGAVRVVPAVSPGYEVLVDGKVTKSNGEELKVTVGASDATGRQWFSPREFKTAVNDRIFVEASKDNSEAFRNVYHRISNALSDFRETLTPEQVEEIRRVAELRFAEDLVPTKFAGYLIKGKKGTVMVSRLPAEGDEMMLRVRRIRERDYMLIDALDTHYDDMHRDMQEVYTNWRKSRLAEMNMIREVDAKQNAQRGRAFAIVLAGAALGAASAQGGSYSAGAGAIAGAAAGAGVALLLDADKISEEAEINKAALEELGVSFSAELEPTILRVEGKTVNLTGTAEQKFKQWREVLAKLYKLETEPASN